MILCVNNFLALMNRIHIYRIHVTYLIFMICHSRLHLFFDNKFFVKGMYKFNLFASDTIQYLVTHENIFMILTIFHTLFGKNYNYLLILSL